MPCNLVAVVVVELQVADANSLRNNAAALESFQQALAQMFDRPIEVGVSGANTPRVFTVFQIDYYRRVEITPEGVQLYGDFTNAERDQIKTFLDGLCSAAAEEALVVAIAQQLPLLSDEPVFDEFSRPIGRVLTINI